MAADLRPLDVEYARHQPGTTSPRDALAAGMTPLLEQELWERTTGGAPNG